VPTDGTEQAGQGRRCSISSDCHECGGREGSRDANAALIVLLRAIAEPLAEWAEARAAFDTEEGFDNAVAHGEALGRFHAADEALFSALSAALKALP
jgi:hypothetical protein